MDMPIIRLDLERMRENISHAMVIRNDEYNEMVQQALRVHLSAENLQFRITEAVGVAFDKAIVNLSNDLALEKCIRDTVSGFVTDKFKEATKPK
jgi:hypothetical protein